MKLYQISIIVLLLFLFAIYLLGVGLEHFIVLLLSLVPANIVYGNKRWQEYRNNNTFNRRKLLLHPLVVMLFVYLSMLILS